MILVTSIQGPNSTNNQHGENNQNKQIKHMCHFTPLLLLVHCQPAPKTRLRVNGCQRGVGEEEEAGGILGKNMHIKPQTPSRERNFGLCYFYYYFAK